MVRCHMTVCVVCSGTGRHSHRLNDSSSPVIMATSLSYVEAKNSHRIKTPDRIEIKFGTVDYIG